MSRPPQQRRLETRARLLEVAATQIAHVGYSGLRVEDVVAEAGVAKGTLFSHFGDKNGLLAVLIGTRIMTVLDTTEDETAPDTLEALIDRLLPIINFVAEDRVIFDLLLRYSGTTGTETDAVITQSFFRQITLWSQWVAQLQQTGALRNDQPPHVLAEGIQAFLNHILALSFCAAHDTDNSFRADLLQYLTPWLTPQKPS
ncbi:TetR/AcrR family transcriptional regulator [Phaeobacter porticola]|uniref:Putative transcriptional regulator, tetR family n=1 Tax=Phaeobacter porticola TaxID=1844006 RepID=A0A1L3I012_9RHOB|nr:TetR/AcrR family transcriptional regulator [Phaeobacter porticola]APG45469.1 putative transcriptional regulator, tetR family [Phaeobacter porticola]